MKKFTGFIFLALVSCSLAGTNEWQWQSSRLPKARVFEGLWSDYFQIVPALHQAGIPYTCVSVNQLPPTDVELPLDSVIVVANLAAPNLKPARLARIKEFVAAGGGLVVLAGRSAYSQGAYVGTPLGEILPVTFEARDMIPTIFAGAPLTRAPGATWLPAFDTAAKPLAFSVQVLKPKPEAVVQLMAGDKPAIVSGTFGQGRVVAVALTVNGNPPPGTLPFWEWPEWPRLLGQAINWAAGARPLKVAGESGLLVASALKPLSTDELNDFALGLKTPDKLLARALAHPSAEVAEALFAFLIAPDATGKLTLAQALPVLVPFAKPEWAARLTERTESLNPNRDDRNAALVLLGATRAPNVTPRLLSALSQPETKLAALEGLGHCSDPKAMPALRETYDAAIRTALVPNETEWFKPDEFAREHAAVATECALALYRLGDPTGLERVLTMHRRANLYARILWTAGRRELRNWGDKVALAQLNAINDLASRIQLYSLDKLRRHAEPIPASQVAAFVKAAQTAADPVDVEWIVAEMERSAPLLPPATWQPLTTAQDGIIARLATVLTKGNPTGS